MDFLGLKNFGVYNDNEHEKRIKNSPSIYHYTTKEAFESILKTKSLWATNCLHFTDETETTHIIPLLEKVANAQTDITRKIYANAITTTVSNFLERDRKFIYIICFSKDKDSMYMWKHEGKTNDVCLEFDTLSIDKKLSKLELEIVSVSEYIYTSNIILNDIIYIDYYLLSNLLKLVDKFIDERLRNEIISPENLNNMTEIFSLGLQLSIFTKSRKYIKENEIRAAFILAEHNYKTAEKYRGNNTPYLDISFEENGRLPLKSIAINPEQNDTMFKESIERLLKSYGYDIPVIPSKNKLRA